MDQKNMTMETEICHNCKREVPQSNYLMHVAHCARNMAVCPVCGDAVPKAHLKDHRQQQHAIVECPACRYKLQSGALEQHRATQCGKRVVACQYCELELPHCDIADHEHYCGARTERCTDCGELVMLKYNKLHLDSNHGFLKLDDEPGPAPSWETPVAPVAPKKSPVKTPFSSMSPLRGSLPVTTSSSTPAASVASRNNNINDIRAAGSAVSTNTASKTDYKKLMHSNTSHTSVTRSSSTTTTSNSSSVESTPPVRDTPRTFVPAYDASEDLRAKVKLARHDLNEIKNSYMMTEERKHTEFGRHPSLELPATNKQSTRDKFITNLVPYEKNKSFQVNARPLDEKPAKKNYYNYLGAKEDQPLQPLIPVVPLASAGLTNGNGTGALPKHKHTHNTHSNAASSNGTVPKQRELGAVPRPTRRRAPPPPVNIPVPQQQQLEPQVMPGSLDEVTLPCEFCDKMIPAARLVQHETGCRPDLAQLHTQLPAVAADTMSPAPAHSPEVELPCEFCFSLYPASKLLSHQALCDV